jgi:hypothetical protein
LAEVSHKKLQNSLLSGADLAQEIRLLVLSDKCEPVATSQTQAGISPQEGRAIH